MLNSRDMDPLSPRILIVDDQPELRGLLAAHLRRHRYEVVEASDGNELLLELLENRPVDLIICDLDMPLMSGLEALIKLRQSDWTMPFILMTGFATPETHQKANQMGAAYVFEKPLDIHHLVSTAQSIVGIAA